MRSQSRCGPYWRTQCPVGPGEGDLGARPVVGDEVQGGVAIVGGGQPTGDVGQVPLRDESGQVV
ncbi:MAG: hypothetical protein ACRDTG_23210, partial [Pseudonocardiaceae bacterium]